MFREMRRKKQALPSEMSAEILERGTSGVLALSGDDGYPYAVPISYVYDGGHIYFHCAKSGHKLDAIARDPRVSFCVVDRDEIAAEKYTTFFRSVIVFGKVRLLENEGEKLEAMRKLALKYAPGDSAESRQAAIQRDWKPLCVLDMTVEHISGKEAIELVVSRG